MDACFSHEHCLHDARVDESIDTNNPHKIPLTHLKATALTRPSNPPHPCESKSERMLTKTEKSNIVFEFEEDSSVTRASQHGKAQDSEQKPIFARPNSCEEKNKFYCRKIIETNGRRMQRENLPVNSLTTFDASCEVGENCATSNHSELDTSCCNQAQLNETRMEEWNDNMKITFARKRKQKEHQLDTGGSDEKKAKSSSNKLISLSPRNLNLSYTKILIPDVPQAAIVSDPLTRFDLGLHLEDRHSLHEKYPFITNSSLSSQKYWSSSSQSHLKTAERPTAQNHGLLQKTTKANMAHYENFNRTVPNQMRFRFQQKISRIYFKNYNPVPRNNIPVACKEFYHKTAYLRQGMAVRSVLLKQNDKMKNGIRKQRYRFQQLKARVAERKAERKSSIIVISSNHPIKILWDALTVLLTFISAYVGHTCIRDRSIYDWDHFVMFTNVWFFIDVLLNFFTDHRTTDGILLRSGREVWGRYLTTWFVIDALSLLPWERMLLRPIIQKQRKRNIVKKWFFRSKAIVKVTRILRGSHLKAFGRVAKNTKKLGVGGKRLLQIIIRYVPKYLLFYRNMKGVLVLKILRQIHFTKKIFRGLTSKCTDTESFGDLNEEDDEYILDDNFDHLDFNMDQEYTQSIQNHELTDESDTTLTEVETNYDSFTDDEELISSPSSEQYLWTPETNFVHGNL